MMRNYNPLVPGTSQASGPMNMPNSHVPPQVPIGAHPMMYAPPPEQPVNMASKVAEVFLTAGHAFQKLGDLTLQLHSTVEPDECKWSEKDVDQLRDSLTRFAHELDMISQSVQGRTTKHIKTDIKRRHLIPDESRRALSPGIKRVAMPTGMPTKRMNIVPSTSNKAIPITRTVVPISSHNQGQRLPSIASHHSQVPSLHNDSSPYMNSGQYHS